MPPYSPQRSPKTNSAYSKPYSPSRSPVHRVQSTRSPVSPRTGTPKSIIRSNLTPSPKRRTQEDYSSMTLEEYIAIGKQNTPKSEANKSPTRSKPLESLTHSTDLRDQRIRVCVRKRPLNKSEVLSKEKDIAQLSGLRTIDILEPKVRVDLTQYIEQHSFTFDNVFDIDSSNITIYQKTTKPLVEHMFEGGKSTCFAFGQTGSGKTYTMLDPKHGLYTLAVMDIFRLLNRGRYSHLSAWVSYYEIYQGQLYDLLNSKNKLIPRDDGKGNVVIAGLKKIQVNNVDTLMKACDYAGSERGTDRGKDSDAKVRMEGAEINRSLLALKECIRALDQEQKRAPFRGSKLTMVLRDSFLGNSKTCMIATISPNTSNSDHTLNTLRYADRIKEFKGESDTRLACSDAQDAPEIESMDTQEDTADENTALPQITKEHVKNFLNEHWIEIHESEEYLKIAKEMLHDINLTSMDSDDFFEKYRDYLTKLYSLLEKKLFTIQFLQNKIKEELCSDDE
ncbi:hypothetical protein G6F37_001627 [Rhizopus arrhizus]|nr:hypothetical protein G6F38_000977 [Rhizopus arrhizus]KAG1163007.1 hypothetical protein G6F37_001627 [Rhizopus arrhizus]